MFVKRQKSCFIHFALCYWPGLEWEQTSCEPALVNWLSTSWRVLLFVPPSLASCILLVTEAGGSKVENLGCFHLQRCLPSEMIPQRATASSCVIPVLEGISNMDTDFFFFKPNLYRKGYWYSEPHTGSVGATIGPMRVVLQSMPFSNLRQPNKQTHPYMKVPKTWILSHTVALDFGALCQGPCLKKCGGWLRTKVLTITNLSMNSRAVLLRALHAAFIN